MPRKRFQTEEIIQKLREAEVLLSQGRNVSEACRQIGVTDNTYYRWRKEYGDIRSDQAKRLKELERENARLKKLVAEAELDKAIPREAASGNEFVITKLRPKTIRDDFGNFRNTSLATRFKSIIRRAGLEPCPKPFVNLRASRDTELRKDYPSHVVESWIGHGDRIAKEHDLIVTDDHFRRASEKRSKNRSGTAQNQARAESSAHGLASERPSGRFGVDMQ